MLKKETAKIPAAAQRALAEAAARRKRAAADSKAEQAAPAEIGGRKEGKEPTRYNDWEFKGRAIDF